VCARADPGKAIQIEKGKRKAFQQVPSCG